MTMRWTPAARAAAIDAQADHSAEVLDATIQHAEALAVEAGSSFVDTDLWVRALFSVTLPESEAGAEDEQEPRP
ncbi:MAG TPA: hypothetical protein VGP82_26145 [Ktedonobacterales bacterium]|jgi:hypothetical protein|nr:hypothetical protein [Ktedonobacterales bacterium]